MPFDDWRIKLLSSNHNAYTKFLNPIETEAYKKFKEWMPCDLFLAATFILPKMIKKVEKYHIDVELAGNHTRGQMVIDHLKKNPTNAYIISEIDIEMFKELMLWVCHHPVDFPA
jgi:inosine-uridine nucleoside N-ribohydrolase